MQDEMVSISGHTTVSPDRDNHTFSIVPERFSLSYHLVIDFQHGNK